MKRFLVAVLVLLVTGLGACGSSDSSDGGEPAQAPAKPSAEAPAAGSEAVAGSGQEGQQQIMDLLEWGDDAGARDKVADSGTCTDEIKAETGSRAGAHGLVVVQRWIQCMEKLGWKRKG